MKKIVFTLLVLVCIAGMTGCSRNRLSYAAINGDVQEIKEGIAQGDNVNDIDRWGWTPLMWAVYYGNFPATRVLLEKGADPNILSQREYGAYLPGTTALILAAAYGRSDAMEELLHRKADPGVVDRKGKKAITYAKESGCDLCVSLLKGK